MNILNTKNDRYLCEIDGYKARIYIDDLILFYKKYPEWI